MKIIMYRGTSGAGKSQHAVAVKDWCRENYLSLAYCSADDYFIDGSFNYKFNHHKLCNAHSECFDKYASALGEKKDVIIVDNTNLTLWEIMPYLQLAKFYDTELHLMQFDAPWQQRQANQKHAVPAVKLRAQTLLELPGHILSHYVKTITNVFDYDYDEAKAHALGYEDTVHLGKYVWLGQIGLTIDSTDCDHCQSVTHRVLDLPAYRNYVDNTYDSAEGPTHISHYHPKDDDAMQEYKKDHIAEAHENGHAWSVTT